MRETSGGGCAATSAKIAWLATQKEGDITSAPPNDSGWWKCDQKAARPPIEEPSIIAPSGGGTRFSSAVGAHLEASKGHWAVRQPQREALKGHLFVRRPQRENLRGHLSIR